MARVSEDAIRKLTAFLDSLPDEARSKCALCNETLTHIVKMAEVASGAGTATVTRELAARVNDGAAPGDRVSPEALRQRAIQAAGEKNRICSNGTNKPAAPPEPKPSRPVRSLHIPSDETRKTDLISPAFEAAFNAFAAECRNAKALGWATTSKHSAVECLRVLDHIINY